MFVLSTTTCGSNTGRNNGVNNEGEGDNGRVGCSYGNVNGDINLIKSSTVHRILSWKGVLGLIAALSLGPVC